MDYHGNLELREREVFPTGAVLERTLGDSYAAYYVWEGQYRVQ